MFALTDLRIPILSSPMAGGPSTPALVHAMATAGGAGFLAGGYKGVDAIAEEISDLRSMGDVPFGVNLFVPAEDRSRTPEQLDEVTAWRTRLQDLCAEVGCDVAEPDPTDTDGWDEKITLLHDLKVPMVSFMFGCPSSEVIASFHAVDTFVTVTVTDEDEARIASERGADALVVQGPEAGGHRGTHAIVKTPDPRPLLELVPAIAQASDRPLIAAGGIADGADVAAALDAGASAVQVGTVLLRTPESGANPQYKDALVSADYDRTAVTRIFSGRLARVLENEIVRLLDAGVPAAYPEVNHMMRGLRQSAIAHGETGHMALFAGTGFRAAEERPAAEVVRALWDEATSQ